MWNLNRRMWNSYMQRMNELNPHSVNTKMNSLAYNKKLVDKQQNADNKYNSIPNMREAMTQVRSDKRTHNLNMINATNSRTNR